VSLIFLFLAAFTRATAAASFYFSSYCLFSSLALILSLPAASEQTENMKLD
jgi:hypothetical protein